MSRTFSVEKNWSIATILRRAPLKPIENRMLIMHVMQLTKIQLITQEDQTINVRQAQELSGLFQRRLLGEPIAYILGQREFYSLQLEITKDVLIPRPETELLVELALQYMPPPNIGELNILDLGTGSGAISVALAKSRPDLKVIALDISDAALAVAKINAERHLGLKQTSIQLLKSNWYSELTDHQFDMIVANPPYVAIDNEHLEQGDLRFEPRKALTDYADGLSSLREIIKNAKSYLKDSGGWLMVEHGYDQSAITCMLLEKQQFGEVQSWKDIAGIKRVSGGLYKARM
jgi:release factor glutamine methyltransferase